MTKSAGGAAAVQAGVNEVVLEGRVSRDPERRDLPSGDVVWTLAVVVDRAPAADGRRRVDAVDCAVWTARLQRSVSTWHAGDRVLVEGSLRRRFYAQGVRRISRVEVEVSRARLIRRATTGTPGRAAASG